MEIENGMPAGQLGGVAWRKSRHSNSKGNCVELAPVGGGVVAIRDSKDPEGPALIHDGAEVAELFAGIIAGEFDDLIAEAYGLGGTTAFDDPDPDDWCDRCGGTGVVTGPEGPNKPPVPCPDCSGG